MRITDEILEKILPIHEIFNISLHLLLVKVRRLPSGHGNKLTNEKTKYDIKLPTASSPNPSTQAGLMKLEPINE